jgi:hypothetical protein
MTDWREESAYAESYPLPWTVSTIGQWKRALSQRANSGSRKQSLTLIERQDMARIWDLLHLADRKQRERDGYPPPGPRPDWVIRALDERR